MLKTLRGKFTLVYAGLALLTALVGLAGVWNLFRLEQSVNNLMTANYKSIDAVSHMMEALERQDSGVLIYIGVDKDSGIDIFAANQAEFLRWFEVEKGNVTEKGESAVISSLQADYGEYSKTIYNMQMMTDGAGNAARNYYLNSTEPLFDKIKGECRQLITINEQSMFASKQKTTDSAKQSMVALLLLSLILMAAGYAAAFYFIKLFLNPIQRLSESIRSVREGSLNQQVAVRTGDEAGRLAGEFNEMTRRLQGYEQSSVGTLTAEKNKSVAIVRSISDPLLVLDGGWRILLINDACGEFFDIEESAVAGRHFLEAIHDGELFESIERLAESGDARGKIISIQKGGEHFFNLTATRVNDPENRNSGYIVAFQNVTGLKELERVRNDFLAAISHEFKTPLTSIMMAASMLREGGMGSLNPDQQETVDAIREDGDRLLGLVNDLLELMRIESGREVYHIEPCSIHEIVEAAVRGFLDAAHAKGVALADCLETGLPPVDADFGKIRWVLNNLIGNALKYTGKGDNISISARREGGFVFISVQDTGTGIPPEYLDRIFDKFVQVEGGGIELEGTGLGLSASREIVRSHGGEISVSSEVGVGSTFTFSMPVSGEGELS
jgi:PAS domain S-box-containing protein